MELNDDNIQKIISWIDNQCRKQSANTTLDLKSLRNPNNSLMQQCPVCQEIPRFPVVFVCGHLECSNCYLSDFLMRFRQIEKIFFTSCPICRSKVYPEYVCSLEDEILHNPNSNLSRFYISLEIQCGNAGCSAYLPYSNLTKHELYQCEHRQINCPANKCPVIGKPETIKLHSVNCPLHRIQCTNCDLIFPIIFCKHSCQLVAERDFLLGTTQFQLNRLKENKEASIQMNVVTPSQLLIDNDNFNELNTVQNIVRLKRGLALYNKK